LTHHSNNNGKERQQQTPYSRFQPPCPIHIQPQWNRQVANQFPQLKQPRYHGHAICKVETQKEKKERNSQEEVEGEERGRREEQDSHVLVEKPNFTNKMQCGIVDFFFFSSRPPKKGTATKLWSYGIENLLSS
jgi:hypothetical protein